MLYKVTYNFREVGSTTFNNFGFVKLPYKLILTHVDEKAKIKSKGNVVVLDKALLKYMEDEIFKHYGLRNEVIINLI